ncbi:Bax inhibitor 1 -like protein [Gossypium arboreum]|uniref:Bax inhibitor 1-like protein n=1 Tax=Gossypium arboreum TaxID=29729 RepID=A0A0B0P0Z8_GOSAR|nr:Bax inhibitor 1 -like protein [Gossypium arboreum]
MDSFSSFFDSQSRTHWSYSTFKNFSQISPLVQSHLKRVYLTLCCALVASAFGAYLHILWNIGGYLTTFACFGTMIWLLSIPTYQEQKRVSLLMASAVFQGASIGPLIDLAIKIDPRCNRAKMSSNAGKLELDRTSILNVLVAAFVGTALAFACFSGAAMLARRREYLYLGGLLSSGVSILMWLHFASSVFGGSTTLFMFEAMDTQDIIEKAHLGDLDYVKQALTLFTDFVAVFVRILIIMLKNSAEKNEKKKKRRND